MDTRRGHILHLATGERLGRVPTRHSCASLQHYLLPSLLECPWSKMIHRAAAQKEEKANQHYLASRYRKTADNSPRRFQCQDEENLGGELTFPSAGLPERSPDLIGSPRPLFFTVKAACFACIRLSPLPGAWLVPIPPLCLSIDCVGTVSCLYPSLGYLITSEIRTLLPGLSPDENKDKGLYCRFSSSKPHSPI